MSDPEKELENDCSLPAGINSQTCLHRDMTSLEKRSVREENRSNIESKGITPTKDFSKENEEKTYNERSVSHTPSFVLRLTLSPQARPALSASAAH